MSEKQPTYNQWNDQMKHGYPSVLVPRRTGEIQVGQIKSKDEDGKIVVTSEKVNPDTKETERSEWHVHPEALSDQVQERLAGKLAEGVADEYRESRDFELRSRATSELGNKALEQGGVEASSTERDPGDSYGHLFSPEERDLDVEGAAVRPEPTEEEQLSRQRRTADHRDALARASDVEHDDASESADRAYK